MEEDGFTLVMPEKGKKTVSDGYTAIEVARPNVHGFLKKRNAKQ